MGTDLPVPADALGDFKVLGRGFGGPGSGRLGLSRGGLRRFLLRDDLFRDLFGLGFRAFRFRFFGNGFRRNDLLSGGEVAARDSRPNPLKVGDESARIEKLGNFFVGVDLDDLPQILGHGGRIAKIIIAQRETEIRPGEVHPALRDRRGFEIAADGQLVIALLIIGVGLSQQFLDVDLAGFVYLGRR